MVRPINFKNRWPVLHLVFIGLLVLQSLSVGVVMLYQHALGEEILLVHARDMMRRLADGAIKTTNKHLKPAENSALITSGLIKSGVLSPDEPEALERYLLEILRHHTSISGLFYGGHQGEFLFVTRQPSMDGNDYLTKIISFNNGERSVELIQRDSAFTVQSRQNVEDDFDPRTRPWYAAFEKQALIWTDPYIFFTSQQPGITASVPITDNQDNLIGAFGVDIELNSLSDFLAQRQISANSSAFIVARNGSMTAHSNIDLIIKFNDLGQPQLVDIDDLTDNNVISTLWSISSGMDNETLRKGSILDFNIGGEKYLAVVQSFPEDRQWPWLMTVIAPENDFIGTLQDARRQQVLQALFFSIAITLFIFLLAGRFLKPVRKLLMHAHFDPLTELYNRRAFFEGSKMLIADAQAKKQPVCIAMIDVDDFKAVNDKYGHSVGDELLTAIAGRLQGALSDRDIIGRYGGEEFVVILSNTVPDQGMKVCERLRLTTSGVPVQTVAGQLNTTVSIGVALLSEKNPDLNATIDQADQALLRAKSSGKNCVVLAQ